MIEKILQLLSGRTGEVQVTDEKIILERKKQVKKVDCAMTVLGEVNKANGLVNLFGGYLAVLFLSSLLSGSVLDGFFSLLGIGFCIMLSKSYYAQKGKLKAKYGLW